MKILVFSELEIQRFKTDEKHIVISIQDPNYDFVKLPEQNSRLDWIGFKFYDLDKDIGKLMKRVNIDIEEEEKENIKDFLWKEFGKELLKHATKNFPNWYKEYLAKQNFGENNV